jgi:hypothetical protein
VKTTSKSLRFPPVARLTPFVDLEAHSHDIDMFVRRRWRGAVGTAAVTLPLAVGILVVSYKLMLFSIVLSALPLIAAADAIRLRKSVGRDGSVRFSQTPQGIVVAIRRSPTSRQPITEDATVPYEGMVARVTPDLVVVAGQRRSWLVPASAEQARAMGRNLASAGVQVFYERGGIVAIAAFLGGALVYRALTVVTTGLVVGALANLALALTHHGGSYVLAAALTGGALVSATLAAILQSLLTPSGQRDGAP